MRVKLLVYVYKHVHNKHLYLHVCVCVYNRLWENTTDILHLFFHYVVTKFAFMAFNNKAEMLN